MACRKNDECLYFAPEIQTLLWIAQEFSAKTTESAIKKLTLWQWEVVRLTHMPQKKKRTGDILDWKTNQPQNMSRIISDNFVVVVVVFSHIFICSKFRHIKYTQIIYIVNGSEYPKRARVHNHYAEGLSLNWLKHLTVSCTESDSGEYQGGWKAWDVMLTCLFFKGYSIRLFLGHLH